jgi:HlyD family secretion protein
MDDSNLRGLYLSAVGKLSATEANLRKLQLGNRPQEIRQARENLNQAQAEIIAVRSTYLGNLALYQAGALGRVAFDGSRSQYLASQERIKALQAQLDLVAAGFRREDIEVARAQVLQARGDLQTIQAQLDDTVIRAPFAGVITQKYADVGAFVTPTTSASATSSATSSSIFALAGQLEGGQLVAHIVAGGVLGRAVVFLLVDEHPIAALAGDGGVEHVRLRLGGLEFRPRGYHADDPVAAPGDHRHAQLLKTLFQAGLLLFAVLKMLFDTLSKLWKIGRAHV